MKGEASQPLWVDVTRGFYSLFPKLLEQQYDHYRKSEYKDKYPKIWKTVGDEIIFCCRLIDRNHLSVCMTAFLQALDEYRNSLKATAVTTSTKPLNVKGAAWLSAFPHRNITVTADTTVAPNDQPDEAFEVSADLTPRSVDFLGNGIDCGFRVASKSSIDKCPLSVELAYLLALEAVEGGFTGTFSGLEKHCLKGVLNSEEYPVIFLDTEEDYRKRKLKQRERKITGIVLPDPIDVSTYLEEFMLEMNMEFPALVKKGEELQLPESYNRFKEAWISNAETLLQRKKEEEEGEKPSNSSGSNIPSQVEDFSLSIKKSIPNDEDGDGSSN